MYYGCSTPPTPTPPHKPFGLSISSVGTALWADLFPHADGSADTLHIYIYIYVYIQRILYCVLYTCVYNVYTHITIYGYMYAHTYTYVMNSFSL